MKAWTVVNDEGYSTVLFAETREKARNIALTTECCEDMEYKDIHARRFKEADSMYRGVDEMDWYNHDDKKFLVEHGWGCEEPYWEECDECDCKDVCQYRDYKEDGELSISELLKK